MSSWFTKYMVAFLLLGFYPAVSLYPQKVFAETDEGEQQFAKFENDIYNLLIFSLEPLYELDQLRGKTNDESLNDIALLAEERFMEGATSLADIEVPSVLPENIKDKLGQVKEDLSIGLTSLSKSMSYFSQYLANHNPKIQNQYIEQRDKGFMYVNGGITTLTTIGLKMAPTEWIDIPNKAIPDVWEAGMEYFYKLEREVQVDGPLE